MKIYVTKGGEMLDDICYQHYGDEKQIDNVMRANRGIEKHPLFLPRGLEITLPELKRQPKKGVRLW